MSNEQSIRDELVQILDDDPLFGRIGYNHAESLADRFLGSPVVRRIQAEALREAADDWHEKHAGTRPVPYLFMVDRADAIERGETA